MKANVNLEVNKTVEVCQKCPLYLSRKKATIDHINLDSNLLFISDAPTQIEGVLGKAFKGRVAKRLLDSLDVEISTEDDSGKLVLRQMNQDDFSYIHLVKCKGVVPRSNLSPFVYECNFYIEIQIRMLAPSTIVVLGRSAAKYFLGGIDEKKKKYVPFDKKLSIGYSYEGAMRDYDDNPIAVKIVYGPSILSDDFESDFKVVNQYLKGEYGDGRT